MLILFVAMFLPFCLGIASTFHRMLIGCSSDAQWMLNGCSMGAQWVLNICSSRHHCDVITQLFYAACAY